MIYSNLSLSSSILSSFKEKEEKHGNSDVHDEVVFGQNTVSLIWDAFKTDEQGKIWNI